MKYLPLFMDLKSKNILVIGAGIVAFNKITLLIRSGAKVKIIAKHLCREVENLVKKKKIDWISTKFHPSYVNKIFLVIAATNDIQLNQKVFKTCNDLFVFVNIVDDQSKCSFIFPSIIDRSPIIVAISSGGTAPVLLRFLREKIEAIIPMKLGCVARIAGKLRQISKKYLTNILERRHFWENIFKSIFVEQIMNGKIKNAINIFRKQIKNFTKLEGRIILVGAGPGDSGLLTLRGLQALQQADVVLYDYLITSDILDLIRRDAKRICVGKKAGVLTITQNEINKLLIFFAKQGKIVVRLKGGDPFIFGRGGEELEAIKHAKIHVQVVPGITSGIGISAYSGIPLTHRQYAQGVIFITGHQSRNGMKNNWSILCDTSYTLVVYMSSLKALYISQKLILYGRLPSTPVAVVGKGTTLNQKVTIGRLDNLEKIFQCTVHPSLLIIGDVVRLHKTLKWFGTSHMFKENNQRSSVVNLL